MPDAASHGLQPGALFLRFRRCCHACQAAAMGQVIRSSQDVDAQQLLAKGQVIRSSQGADAQQLLP